MKKQILTYCVALLAALTYVGCGSNSSGDVSDTTTSEAPESAVIGAAVGSIFSNSSCNQALILATEVEGEGQAAYDICADEGGPEGITFDPNVPAATYGSSKVVEADFTCDSSQEATSCITWAMPQDVQVCGITFQAGSHGIYCIENEEEIVDGSFYIDGTLYLCHLNVGDGPDFSTECVDENGNALATSEEVATCQE